jgi:histidyl-tRNA synthetase
VENAPKAKDFLCAPCETHWSTLKTRLKENGVSYVEDPHIVRGLDYYNRTAFEFDSPLLGAQSALGGGGRYDGLSERFGEASFPAIGWALGMERLMLALEGVTLEPGRAPTFYFAALGASAFSGLFKLSLFLKKKGLSIEIPNDADKKLKNHLKQADRIGAHYAVIVGEDEEKKGIALLKNLKLGTQIEIPLFTLDQELLKIQP